MLREAKMSVQYYDYQQDIPRDMSKRSTECVNLNSYCYSHINGKALDKPDVLLFDSRSESVGEGSQSGPIPGEAAQKKVVIVDSRNFFRECLQRGIESALSMPVEALGSISELDGDLMRAGSVRLLIVSLVDGTRAGLESANALGVLSNWASLASIIILSPMHDFEVMRAAISRGARGYIPMTMGFEIAIEAVRFVLAGGVYVPAESLLSAAPGAPPIPRPPGGEAITTREMAVVRAIQQGKPNKIIAYELNMCENTVKVHVRHIMKKLGARNRTDVAIKSAGLLSRSS
jgi:DNA-binding NarL/FixJ family response regulator